ncbi:mtp family protein [Triplophysa rosa]|uniref:Lysosomal protein transmembrane 5 n=1 Tax=Triplophysa rosa TaxID=992332 RepID=A0A9W7TMK7_TRIRA|nr:mtp family protein [Triplophysa rosa]KAI7798802.1 lysosomal protein transmembrane 5 [Triplophysa rosa]
MCVHHYQGVLVGFLKVLSDTFSLFVLSLKTWRIKMSGKRSLCCHVTTATRSFAILYLICNMLELGDIIRKASWEKTRGIPYHDIKSTRCERIFDFSTNIVMLVLMSISCVFVLFSQRKGPMFVLPFVMLVFVDLGVSFLSLFNGAWGLPGTPKYKDVLQAAKYYKGVDRLDEEDMGHFIMGYTVLFIFNILLKVYVLQVSMRCFYALMGERAPGMHVDTGNTVTVKLPSYDEALKMKTEGVPPSYQEP